MDQNDDSYGLSGSVHDTDRERRHQKRVDQMPFALRQIDEAARHPTPSVRPDEPKALTGDELKNLQQLLARLRPTQDNPFPAGWLDLVTKVLRLADYSNYS